MSSFSERDLKRLKDILRYGGELQGYLDGVSEEEYRQDRKLQLITERLLEIVGEASGALTLRARAAIPFRWSAVKALRNILAHDYGRVDHGRLYNLATEDLDELVRVVQQVMNG